MPKSGFGRITRRIAKSVGFGSNRKIQPKAGIDGVLGTLDQFGSGRIRGWAALQSDLNRGLRVNISLDDRPVIQVMADVHRPDLKEAGFGDGNHAFDVTLPKRLQASTSLLTISVEAAGGPQVFVQRTYVREADPSIRMAVPTIHLDITDLLTFLSFHRIPSGIQRVQIGYVKHLMASTHPDRRYILCGRFTEDLAFYEIEPTLLARLLREAADEAHIPSRQWMAHVKSFRALNPVPSSFRAGDVLLTLGAPWAIPDHTVMVASFKKKYGIFYYQVFYDLIPIVDPEYVSEDLLYPFSESIAATITYADHIFSISQHSSSELDRVCRDIGIACPPMSVVPMGAGIDYGAGPASKAQVLSGPGVLDVVGLGDFVLCVGTIEPRKNHLLLYNVWNKLSRNHPGETIPKLVLVGRFGWHMEDLQRRLKVTANLGGLIVLLSDITDADLYRLYEACLFTVFPSFTEGWGLPIVESFNHGKLCVCSNLTAMREAGGEIAIYIDPYALNDCYATIERLIYDRGALADYNRRVGQTYTPLSWEVAAATFDIIIGRAIGGHAARGRNDGPSIALDTVYDLRRPQAGKVAKVQLAEAVTHLTAKNALEGPLWFEPTASGTWSLSPQARMKLRFDTAVAGPLCCFIGLQGDQPERMAAVSVDGRAHESFTLAGADADEIAVVLPAWDGAGALREHLVAITIDQHHAPDEIIPFRPDQGTGYIRLDYFYVCQDTIEHRLAYRELQSRQVIITDVG